jgi:hypothetical protein
MLVMNGDADEVISYKYALSTLNNKLKLIYTEPTYSKNYTWKTLYG